MRYCGEQVLQYWIFKFTVLRLVLIWSTVTGQLTQLSVIKPEFLKKALIKTVFWSKVALIVLVCFLTPALTKKNWTLFTPSVTGGDSTQFILHFFPFATL